MSDRVSIRNRNSVFPCPLVNFNTIYEQLLRWFLCSKKLSLNFNKKSCSFDFRAKKLLWKCWSNRHLVARSMTVSVIVAQGWKRKKGFQEVNFGKGIWVENFKVDRRLGVEHLGRKLKKIKHTYFGRQKCSWSFRSKL